MTGYDGNIIKHEIPNVVYSNDYHHASILLPDEIYTYRIVGTGDSNYTLPDGIQTNGREQNFIASNIPIKNYSIHEYKIDWDRLLAREQGVTVRIDQDGDGIFETTISSDMELTAEEFKEAVSRPVLSFKLTPRTFNLDSNGVLTAHVELISGDKNRIDQNSWKLNDISPTKINTEDNSWKLKFDRNKFSSITIGEQVNFELSVKIKNATTNPLIKLTDSIRTIQNQNSNNNSSSKGKKK